MRTAGIRPRRGPDDVTGTPPSDAAVHRLICDLSAITFSLAPCAAIGDEAVAGRIADAIEQLDRIIRDVRVNGLPEMYPPTR